MSRVGVMAALPCEGRALVGTDAPPGVLVETTTGILLGVAGAGPGSAAALAGRLLEHGADRLMSWGFAGGLVAGLKPGALVLPQNLVGGDGCGYAVDECWRTQVSQALEKHFVARREGLAESTTALTCTGQKRALNATTCAIAVDMESAAVARAAAGAGVPFLCVRAVVDSLEHEIPIWIPDQLHQGGNRVTGAFARRALLSPRDWGALLALSLAFARALRRLRQAAPMVIEVNDNFRGGR